MNTYDETTYPSYAYDYTAPERMGAIGRLFGMVPHDLENARVLEIGCASGGNILPMAARYPNATFVGIDYSAVQIDLAEKAAAAMNLDNVTFHAKSILNIKLKNEKFDFIIAHRVYSWVPEVVRKRILEICGDNLSRKGVAYISYNTLPGWNSVKTIRDMMLYHGRNFSDPSQKVLEARRMLNFVSENIQASAGPHKQLMEYEIKTLQDVDDNYLLHDHLEATNDPCYFHEFIDQAKKQGLQYLADAELPTMYLGNHTDQVSSTLMQLNSNIEQEQYLDFINNRRFRMTLLTHDNVELKRNVDISSIESLLFSPNFALKDAGSINVVTSVESLDMVSVNNAEVTATLTGKIECACYIELLKAAPVPRSLDDIVKSAVKILNNESEKDIRSVFGAMVLQMIFKGMLSITSGEPGFTKNIADKPEIFPPARVQAMTLVTIPNMLHQMVKLSDDQRVVAQYVTGENTKEQIISALEEHINKGELTINADGNAIEKGSDDMEKYLPQYIDAQLSFFANNALLVA